MTVKELIEKLQGFNPDAVIVVETSGTALEGVYVTDKVGFSGGLLWSPEDLALYDPNDESKPIPAFAVPAVQVEIPT